MNPRRQKRHAAIIATAGKLYALFALAAHSQARLIAPIEGRPFSLWTLQRLVDDVAERTGIRVSDETVRRALKRVDIVLSRPQHPISRPDPEYQVQKRRLKQHATTSGQTTCSTTLMPVT
jgi:hypothetical protein